MTLWETFIFNIQGSHAGEQREVWLYVKVRSGESVWFQKDLIFIERDKRYWKSRKRGKRKRSMWRNHVFPQCNLPTYSLPEKTFWHEFQNWANWENLLSIEISWLIHFFLSKLVLSLLRFGHQWLQAALFSCTSLEL